MKLPCDYAILRFLPYPETEEFVNIGIVIVQATRSFFNFRIERRRRRITTFFNELDSGVYRTGLNFIRQELEKFRDNVNSGNLSDTLGLQFHRVQEAFRNLVRPRESIFRFSSIRTVMTKNPTQKLDELFDNYVDRQFAVAKEYQETVMADRLKKLFDEANLSQFYKSPGTLGCDDYEINVPFVYRKDETVLKAIKPLSFTQESTAKVMDHGDLWLSRLRRLKERNAMPNLMIFPVAEPTAGRRGKAAREIIRELEEFGAAVIPFEDHQAVITKARP